MVTQVNTVFNKPVKDSETRKMMIARCFHVPESDVARFFRLLCHHNVMVKFTSIIPFAAAPVFEITYREPTENGDASIKALQDFNLLN